MPRPSTPPAAPSTPLFSFPHPSTPFNAGPFGPAALHPTGRIAFRPPAPQSRKQTSTPVFPARPHRIAPDPLHCISPSCVAKPQTNLNPGFSRSAPPHCTRPSALHSALLRRKAANKPQPRFPRSAPPHCIRPVAPPAPEDLHPPPSELPAPDACRPPVTPQRLRLFSPCRSPRPFARHLRSLDAASSSPPQGKHPDFRSEARFFAH